MTTASQEPSSMGIDAIREAIASGHTTSRMRAITALQPYDVDTCVPLLLECLNDQAFLVRSLACMGLGYKANEQGKLALLKVLKLEGDPNVRAEAANALARHGMEQALPALLDLYKRDTHWLVRSSILAALADEKDVTPEVLVKLAEMALVDADPTLQEAGKQLKLKLQRESLERLLS